jgi:hypothetical protein
MPSAKLIKALEKQGFFLDFPSYQSHEEIIMEILKENNQRISRSLPLFLKDKIDYKRLCSKLNAKEKKELDKAIIISLKIYEEEKIESSLKETISENKVRSKFSKQEFEDFYYSFKESLLKSEKSEEKIIEKQSKLRLNLDLNKSLAVLFSPAKISIMKKIFNHQALTNTELKYYYKAISSINKAALNPPLQDYLRVIETTRKISEKK